MVKDFLFGIGYTQQKRVHWTEGLEASGYILESEKDINQASPMSKGLKILKVHGALLALRAVYHVTKRIGSRAGSKHW